MAQMRERSRGRNGVLLGAFPVVGLGDGAVLVSGGGSGLGGGGISVTSGFIWESIVVGDSRLTRSSSSFMYSNWLAAMTKVEAEEMKNR